MKKTYSNSKKNTSILISKPSKTIGLLLMAFLFGNAKKLKLLFTFLLLVLLQTNGFGAAQTYYSRQTGSWSSSTTWSTVSFASATNAGTIPVAGDTVNIGGGFTVTVTAAAACASMTIASGSTLAWSGNFNLGISTLANAGTINKTGSGTINAPLASFTNTGTVNAGGTGTITGITNNAGGIVNVTSTQTITSLTNATSTSTVNISSGTFTISTLTATAAGNTVNYNGAAQTVIGITYSNLTLSGSGNKTLGGVITVNNNLFVSSGATLIDNDFQITGNATGTLTVQNGAYLQLGGASTVANVNATAFPTLFTNPHIDLQTGSEVVYNYNGVKGGVQTISNVPTYYNLECQYPGTKQGAAGTLTVKGFFETASSLDLNTNDPTINLTGDFNLLAVPAVVSLTSNVFSIGGNFNNTLTSGGSIATANGTVTFNGTGAQSITGGSAVATPFYNLIVNKVSGTLSLVNSNQSVASDLTVTAGTLDLGTYTLNRVTSGGTLSVANGATLKIGGTNNYPTNFTANTFLATSTVEYYATTGQTVSARSYGNLILSGSGSTKTFTATTAISNNLAIASGVIANLGTGFTHTAGTLTLNGVSVPTGSWGSTTSAANYKNNTYFAAVTGQINVPTAPCTAGYWTGNTSTDWSVATNWCNGTVPTSATNVVIAPGVANMPIITTATAAVCANLTINSGATLTNSSTTGSLSISGNFVNNGTFIASTSSTTNTGGNLVNSGTFTANTSSTINTGNLVNSGTFTANASSTTNISVDFVNTGTFTADPASTTNFIGANQSVAGVTYGNLNFYGGGTKTFAAAATISNNLVVASGVSVNLGTGLTHSAGTLTLNGFSVPTGSWGSTTSAANYKNNTYFTAVTGQINVPTASCTAGYWTGSTSTDWSIATNWCNGVVPTSATDVVIPAGVANMPTILNVTNAFCNNLTVNNGTTLTNNGSLSISGNFSNAGTYTAASASTTSFVGANQNVAGVVYGNLTISGSGTKTLMNNTTVNGTLTVKANTTLALGSFTLGSSSVSLECAPTTGLGSIISGDTSILNQFTFKTSVTVTKVGTGSSGATITCPAKMGGSTSFNVDDDGSTAIDLAFSYCLNGISATTLTKTGLGTMQLINTSPNGYTGATVINAGIFQCGNTSVIPIANDVTMSGGTLSTNGNTQPNPSTLGPTYRTLTLTNNSTIALGTGSHRLDFYNSSLIGWTSGKTLTITGWTGLFDGTSGTSGTIRVGTTNGGLTATQLAQIRFYNASTLTYYPATILATGEVVPLATITTNAITGPFCVGTSGIAVGFVYTLASSFPSGITTFTAQLSNSTGSFASPTSLGTVGSNASGTQTISATIPLTTPAGTGYRIRVVSNSPAVNGTDNGADLTINSLPTTPTAATPTQPNCVTATGSVALSNLPTSGTWTLYQNGSPLYTITGGTGTLVVPGLTAAGSPYNFTVNNGTCTSLPVTVVISAAVATIWNGASWSSGTPTSSDTATIAGNYNTTTNGTLNACKLTINSPYILTINGGDFVTIQNDLTVATGATLNILDKGSLVMINDSGTVTGSANVSRATSPYKKNDYVYWSSPVVGATIASTFTGWRLDYAFDYGTNWNYNLGTMIAPKGYIVMVPNPVTTPATTAVTFTGKVNNGLQQIPGVSVNSDYLVGNPYPSALYADQFIVTNAGVIDGTLSFWTHNTAIQLASNITNGTAGSGAYAYTSDDYAYYNLTGGVGTGLGTLANSTGTAPYPAPKPSGKIGTGQGFFVKTKPSISGTAIVFNNAMRLDQTGAVLNNSQFFKTKAPVQKTVAIEKNRVWLNLLNDQGAFKQILVGYISGATNAIDNLYDGETLDGNDYVDFYSVNEDKNLVIQGRALPFDDKDEVPLGFKSSIAGKFAISIDEVDGLFSNQSVFLEDKLANTVIDLKTGDYNFTTEIGTFNDRFVLKYVDKTLGTEDLSQQVNQVLVSVKNKQIKVDSAVETITKVVIYDVSGKQLYQKEQVNSNELVVANFTTANQVLIVKTTLKNGKTVTDKVVY